MDSDYESLRANLRFSQCSKEVCTSVVIIDDETVEELEWFDLTLERLPGVNTHVILEPSRTRITIAEDNNDGK